ncbi:hypothetical protein D3C78_1014920 [compost metagenome]
MGAVDLHAVQAPALTLLSGCRIGCDDFVDHRRRHRQGRDADGRAGHIRRGPGRAAIEGQGVVPAMPELLEQAHPMRADGLDQPAVAVLDVRAEHVERGRAGGVDREDLDDRQAGSPLGPGQVIVDQGLAHGAGAQIGGVGGAHDPVGKLDAADLDGRVDVGQGHLGLLLSYCSGHGRSGAYAADRMGSRSRSLGAEGRCVAGQVTGV